MRSVRITIALAGLAAVAAPLGAQSFWLPEGGKRSLSIESYRVHFADSLLNSAYTFATSAYFVTYNATVGPRLQIQAELPFAFGDIKSSFRGGNSGLGSEFTVSNPYLGIRATTGSNTSVEAGVRVPLTLGSHVLAGVTGFAADRDRLVTFTPDIASAQVLLNYTRRFTSGAFVGLRAGPVLTLGTNSSNDTDLLTRYAAKLGYRSTVFEASAGLSGMLPVTEMGNLASRTVHQARLNAGLRFKRVRPGLSVLIPLDGRAADFFDAAYGITLGIDF